MGVNIDVDINSIQNRFTNRKLKATRVLTTQVVKDSNYYAPQDQGILQNSAITSSDYDKGKVVWNTPYARRLYYGAGFNFSTDKNPNAQAFWFERAKADHCNDWANIVENNIKGAN